MNIDREFLCSNGDLNPNQFSVKLGQDVVIHPNSEIGVSKLKFNNHSARSIDGSNDTFVLLWGQAGMDADPTTARSSFDLLPPQKFHLEHGLWRLTVPSSTGAGFQAGGSDVVGYGDPNIMTNLIDTLNEHNLYQWWGFAGKYTSQNVFKIWTFLKPHSRGIVGLQDSILSGRSRRTNVNVGGSIGFTQIRGTEEGWASIGSYNCPMPYSANVIPGTATNLEVLMAVTLMTRANVNVFVKRAFGGLILDSQEFYKSTQSYNQNIDWCGGLGDNGEIINYEDIINQIPISWEVEPVTGNIVFKRREILNNGLVGEVVEIIDGGATYDGSVLRNIRLIPILTNLSGTPAVATTKTRFFIDCHVGAVSVGLFEIDDSYFFGEKYRFAHVWQTEDRTNPAAPVLGGGLSHLFGVDESRFSLNGASLGTISRGGGEEFGNINLSLITSPIESDSILPITPNTTSNYQLQQLTNDCNMTMLKNEYSSFYYMDGETVTEALPLEINTILEYESMGLSLNVDNLPISTDLCKPVRGISQKRIYTLMTSGTQALTGSYEQVEEPNNINWKMLHNKSPLIINHLDFRWTDLDGRNCNALEGRCYIIIKIRTNPHRMFQQIYLGAVRNKRQVLETYNTTEENFKLSQSVI